MGRKGKQFYVVLKGKDPGIYTEWFGEGGAAEQVQGFPDAMYRGFHSQEEALDWLKTFPPETRAALPEHILASLNEFAEGQGSLSDEIAELLASEVVLIFTDGSADAQTGVGGYGVVLRYQDHEKELSGGFRGTTNNRMELMACIAGLQALKKKSSVVIFSDSQYVVNGIAQGWAQKWQAQEWKRRNGEPVDNADLWAELLALCEQHQVEFRWLRGHSGRPENERCDRLARQAAGRNNLPLDE